MRSLAALGLLLFGSGASAAEAEAEPAWSGKTLTRASWCRVEFPDEFGEQRSLWCPADRCCPKELKSTGGHGFVAYQEPLFDAVQKESAEVDLPYFEAETSKYILTLRTDGAASVSGGWDFFSHSPVERTAGPGRPDDKVVVSWTGRSKALTSPLSGLYREHVCAEGARLTLYDPSAKGAERDWHKSRFFMMEIEMADGASIGENAGTTSLLSCPKDKCGEPGTLADFRAGNRLPISRYAEKLRGHLRRWAETMRTRPVKAGEADNLTSREANLLNCLVHEAQSADPASSPRKAFLGLVKRSTRDQESLEGFVRTWRAFLRAELAVYLKLSEGHAGEVKGHKEQLDGILERLTLLLAGKDLTEAYREAGILPARKPKVGKKAEKKVADAGDWLEEQLK